MAHINVRLIEGKNLLAADTNGLSDPYVKLYLGPKQKFKSKTKPKTLSPQWNESFYFTLRPEAVKTGRDTLKITVWDSDAISKDDLLGSAYVLFGLYELKQNVETVIKVDLDTQGEIYIGITALDFSKQAFEGRYIDFVLNRPKWIVHYLDKFYNIEESGALTTLQLAKCLEAVGWDSSYTKTIQFIAVFVDIDRTNHIDVNEFLELQGFIVAVTAVWNNRHNGSREDIAKCLSDLGFGLSSELNAKLFELVDFDNSGSVNGYEVFNLFFLLRMCDSFFVHLAPQGDRDQKITFDAILKHLPLMSTDLWPIRKVDQQTVQTVFKEHTDGTTADYEQFIDIVIEMILISKV